MSNVKEEPRFKLEIVKWDGKLHCCYLNDFRIAGGKPWGGGQFVKSWSVPLKDVISAIPELRAIKSDFDAQRLRADTAEGALEALRYKAELYDEVWADATGRGYANVTMALCELTAAEQRIAELTRALAGMLFAFDDGVGRDWSAPLLDYARKLTNAAEFDATLNPNPEAESHEG